MEIVRQGDGLYFFFYAEEELELNSSLLSEQFTQNIWSAVYLWGLFWCEVQSFGVFGWGESQLKGH